MLGTESVLAHLRDLAHGRPEEDPARMSLVENTAAAVAAGFARRALDGPWLQVAIRERADVIEPPPAGAVQRPPTTAILKQGSRALAVLLGDMLVVSRTAPRCVRTPLVREARERMVDYELVPDGELESLAGL